MSFLSLLFALLIEQARPLNANNWVHGWTRAWVTWVQRHLDTGESGHAWFAWVVVVLLPAVVSAAVHWALLLWLGWIAAVVWNIAVLYVTLGFRQFSHKFTDIREALDAADEDAARRLLAQWMRIDASDLPRSEIVRQVISHSVVSAHRYVFGVFAWYSLLSGLGFGPAGAVLYRLAEYSKVRVQRSIGSTRTLFSAALRRCVAQAWALVDWLPARLTALVFAFVGSFEEAIERWRTFEAAHPGDNDGILLAATGGAVNVQLIAHDPADAASTAQPAHLRAVVGLVWRTVVMWMVILALLSLARLLG
ncbi:MAG: cobalamin biosynthesis protein [Betaproteobacteria bacterium]